MTILLKKKSLINIYFFVTIIILPMLSYFQLLYDYFTLIEIISPYIIYGYFQLFLAIVYYFNLDYLQLL